MILQRMRNGMRGLHYSAVHEGDPIENGVIHTDRAKMMNCITTAVVNGQTALKYQSVLDLLEHCLVHVAGKKFVEHNDSSFVVNSYR